MNKFHPVSKSNMGDLEFRSQLIPLDLNGDGNMDFVSTRYARKSVKIRIRHFFFLMVNPSKTIQSLIFS